MHLSIYHELETLIDPTYKSFTCKLLPNIHNILGVRLPELRRIAKRLAKTNNPSVLEQISSTTFEETMLKGMVIGYLVLDTETTFILIHDFLPLINNWSTCDSFCSGLKITKTYPCEMWTFIQPYFTHTEPFYIRFALVMVIYYYTDLNHLLDIFNLLDNIHHSNYYVKIAVAWSLSICYLRFPSETLPYLHTNRLDDFTYNKALQKICESNLASSSTKSFIKTLKRI